MTSATHDPVALRVQRLDLHHQTLVLGQLAASRSGVGVFAPSSVAQLFSDFSLPAPAKIANVFSSLTAKKWFAKQPKRAAYKVTPLGQAKIREHMSDLDLATLIAEAAQQNAPILGRTEHTLIPFHLAPPALLQPVQDFLAEHPFDTNVFGMTRFPDARAGTEDPVSRTLAVIREVCAEYGLELHLASDRSIVDDLWANVSAHMWACRYGVALFEDRVARGLNHNLLIEVGAMIMAGRRCALLKDGSIEKMPTDFVGMIYKSVEMSAEDSVAEVVRAWVVKDLSIGIL